MKRKLKPTPVTVRGEWMRHWPTRPYSFWVEVAKHMRANRISSRNTDGLLDACRIVEQRRAK